MRGGAGIAGRVFVRAVLRSPGLAVLRRSRGDVLAGLDLDERDEQPRTGESPQSGPFSFTTIRIRRQDRGETRIRCPIVTGELLAARRSAQPRI